MMNDLISSQTAIDEIKALYEWHDTVTEDRTIDHLKRLPSVEPDVPDTNVGDMIKTGKWISQVGGGYCCSKCGRYALHDVDGKFALLFTKSKYCPHCGAKMEVQND